MTKKELFMANLDGEFTSRVPIWIMRQAGRYLPQYREFRKNISFEELCKTPKAVAEVAAQPVEILDLDAAIIFSDILFILEPLGVDVRFDPGPIISPFLEKPEQVLQMAEYDPESKLQFVADALIETRRRLGNDIPLLGFCGAPFTVFCYLTGIRGARDFHKTIRFLTNYPDESALVLERLAKMSIRYLRMQSGAGADVVQIFDTWAGELGEKEFAAWSFPYLKMITEQLAEENIRTSLYIKGAYHLLDYLRILPVNVVSLDWKTPLWRAAELLEPKTLQGNLDPHLLLGNRNVVVKRATDILHEMADYSGFIFNLGHGILPDTPVENVRALVETVHSYERTRS